MMTFLRRAAFVAPAVVWTVIIIGTGTSGTNGIWMFFLALLAGGYLGYYVVQHYAGGGTTVEWWRIAIAIALILSPLYFFFKGEGHPPTQDASATSSLAPPVAQTPDGRSFENGDIVATRKPDLTQSYQDIASENRSEGVEEGREIGREEAYAPTKKLARSNDEVPAALTCIGNNQWALRFTMPGPDLLETGLDFPLWKVYYISTVRTIPRLQVGWVDDRGASKFAMPPSSEFKRENPLRYRMESVAQNARVVFSTSLVPDGVYEIRITACNVDLGENEYAPGVPVTRHYRTQ